MDFSFNIEFFFLMYPIQYLVTNVIKYLFNEKLAIGEPFLYWYLLCGITLKKTNRFVYELYKREILKGLKTQCTYFSTFINIGHFFLGSRIYYNWQSLK